MYACEAVAGRYFLLELLASGDVDLHLRCQSKNDGSLRKARWRGAGGLAQKAGKTFGCVREIGDCAALSPVQAQTSTSLPNPFQFSFRLLAVFLLRRALVAAAPDGRVLSCTLSVLPRKTLDAGLMVLWARTMACARVTESTRMGVSAQQAHHRHRTLSGL